MDWINTSLPDFKLRFARPGDEGLILAFIRELAEYEKLSDEVVADETLLRQHLFGNNPTAEVILGCRNEEPVGFALFFHNFPPL